PDVFISEKTQSHTQSVFIASPANHSAKSYARWIASYGSAQFGGRMHLEQVRCAVTTYFCAISKLGPWSFRSWSNVTSAAASPASNLILVGDSIGIASLDED